MQDSSAEAMRERNLRPALQPKVEIVSAAEGADLEYKMSVEVLPDMPQPDFAALGLERLVVEMPDEDVDKAVERIAEQQRKSEPVERAAESGDIVVVDIVGKSATRRFPAARAKDATIELGAEGLLPGFDRPADRRQGRRARARSSVTFPEDYGNPEFAGKEAVFEVAVKEVRERQPAVIDDALAKAVGLENLAELRQEVRERMQRDYEHGDAPAAEAGAARQARRELRFPGAAGHGRDRIQQHLAAVRGRKRPMPPAQAPGAPRGRRGRRGRPPGPAPAEAAPKLLPCRRRAGRRREAQGRIPQDLAERRVRLGLLLAEVGRNNNITVTQDELNQALTREARRHPGYERQVLDFYRKIPRRPAICGRRSSRRRWSISSSSWPSPRSAR